jgi:hypothetical protein
MKKILTTIILCLLLLLCFCSCGNKITHGEVYEKEHREAYTTVMFIPITISNGKSISTTMVPYIIRYPERWVIHIREANGEEWVTEDFYVSKEIYDTIEIGDMFEYDEERGDLQEEPYTKEKQEN